MVGRFGSWNNALGAAGLPVNTLVDIPDAVLLENLADVWRKLGRQPVGSNLDKEGGVSRFSLTTYEKRFGSWNRALQAFSDFSSKSDTTTDPRRAGHSPQACGGNRVSPLQIVPRRRNIPREIMVKDLRRVADQAPATSVTAAVYSHKGGFGVNTILRRFGSWEQSSDGSRPAHQHPSMHSDRGAFCQPRRRMP